MGSRIKTPPLTYLLARRYLSLESMRSLYGHEGSVHLTDCLDKVQTDQQKRKEEVKGGDLVNNDVCVCVCVWGGEGGRFKKKERDEKQAVLVKFSVFVKFAELCGQLAIVLCRVVTTVIRNFWGRLFVISLFVKLQQ